MSPWLGRRRTAHSRRRPELVTERGLRGPLALRSHDGERPATQHSSVALIRSITEARPHVPEIRSGCEPVPGTLVRPAAAERERGPGRPPAQDLAPAAPELNVVVRRARNRSPAKDRRRRSRRTVGRRNKKLDARAGAYPNAGGAVTRAIRSPQDVPVQDTVSQTAVGEGSPCPPVNRAGCRATARPNDQHVGKIRVGR